MTDPSYTHRLGHRARHLRHPVSAAARRITRAHNVAVRTPGQDNAGWYAEYNSQTGELMRLWKAGEDLKFTNGSTVIPVEGVINGRGSQAYLELGGFGADPDTGA